MISSLINLNKYCLYALILAASFEYWDPFNISSSFSFTRMTTVVYLMSSFPLFRTSFNFSYQKKYIWPLLLLILSGILSCILNDAYFTNYSEILNTRLIQLVILMFVITAHLSSDRKLLEGVLTTFVMSIFLMSTLNLFFGIGNKIEAGRLFIFGENPNLTGMKTAIAILIIIARLISDNFSIKKLIISGILMIPIIFLMISSGSRGALFSMILGILLLFILLKISFVKKFALFIVGIFSCLYLISFINTEYIEFGKRINSSIINGETAGRKHLWNSGYRIIEDNFLFGVGTPGLLPVMRAYSGKYIEPHNIFLYVWITAGFFGFIFFVVFLFRLITDLFRDYLETGKILNLSIFLVILINISKSGGSIGFISIWIFFAVFIASKFVNTKKINF